MGTGTCTERHQSQKKSAIVCEIRMCKIAKLHLWLMCLHKFKNKKISFVFTCSRIDGLAHQTDAGVVTSQHSNGVVLATCQIAEITVGVGAVAFIIVTEATPGVHSIGCGPTRPIPRHYCNACLTVHSCREVAGNTWSWWNISTQISVTLLEPRNHNSSMVITALYLCLSFLK